MKKVGFVNDSQVVGPGRCGKAQQKQQQRRVDEVCRGIISHRRVTNRVEVLNFITRVST